MSPWIVGALLVFALVSNLWYWFGRRKKKPKTEGELEGEDLDRVAWTLYEFRRKTDETDDELRARMRALLKNRRG